MTTLNKDKEALANGLREMVEEVDSVLKAAAHSGDAKFDELREKFSAQLRHLRAELEELEDNAIHKARHAARVTDQAVHTHPYGAMGIAAAVGLLIGFLVARR